MLPPASDEQLQARDRFCEGHNVLVQAVAGGGKTTGFLYAGAAAHEQDPDGHILLICYNKALQISNQRRLEGESMAGYMSAFTVHGLASQMFGLTIADDAALDAALNSQELCDRITLPARFTDIFVDELQDMSTFTLAVINLVIGRVMSDRAEERLRQQTTGPVDDPDDDDYRPSSSDDEPPGTVEYEMALQRRQCLRRQSPPAKRQRVEEAAEEEEAVLGPRLVCVGDRRQEIYGYSGDHTGLRCLDAPEKMFVDTGRAWCRCRYSVSFRLTPAVCEFVNRQFSGTPTGPSVDIVPGNTRHVDRKPIYIVGDMYEEGVRVVREMLTRYEPDEIMILAPTVEVGHTPSRHVVNCLSGDLCSFYVTDRMRGLSEDVEYEDKVLVTTFHQVKGGERPCVIVFADESCIWDDRDPDRPAHCHNSLHVALTRAQETLVVVQHSANGSYPTVDEATLATVADLRLIDGDMPGRSSRHRRKQTRLNRTVDWLTKHCPVTVHNRILALAQQVSDLRSIGDAMDVVPRTSVIMPPLCNHENTIRYFPAAIMAAAERQLTAPKAGRRHRTDLERQVVVNKDNGHWTPVYRAGIDLVADGSDGPQGSRDWLMLSVMGDAIDTGYYHRLRQMSSFEWVQETERTFFARCVENIAKALSHQADGFFVQRSRMYKRVHRFRSVVPCVQSVNGGSEEAPWSFCFGTEPSQGEILTLICNMWVCYATVGYLLVVPDNLVKTIEFEGHDQLDQAIGYLVHNKTS